MKLALDAVEHARRVGFLHLTYHVQHPRVYEPRNAGRCAFCKEFA